MSTCQQDSQILKIYSLIETSELYLAYFPGQFFHLEEALSDVSICRKSRLFTLHLAKHKYEI